MTLSRLHVSLLGATVIAVAALLAWLLLRKEPVENYVIESSIKPDTYITTRIDETPAGEPATPTQAGIPDGYGVVTHEDGSIYVGNFVGGLSQGQGKITYPGGASFEGEFSEGIPHGKGVCTYSSGESEDCAFLLGQRQ